MSQPLASNPDSLQILQLAQNPYSASRGGQKLVVIAIALSPPCCSWTPNNCHTDTFEESPTRWRVGRADAFVTAPALPAARHHRDPRLVVQVCAAWTVRWHPFAQQNFIYFIKRCLRTNATCGD